VLSQIALTLLNRCDFKFDFNPYSFIQALELRADTCEPLLAADFFKIFQLIVLHPQANIKTSFWTEEYQTLICYSLRIKPVEVATAMKNLLIALKAIYSAIDNLKGNHFDAAQKCLARAHKYDGGLLDCYIVQVFDRFKTCYSFTPEQYTFLLHSPAVLATEKPSQLMFLGHQLAFGQLADRDPQAAGDLFNRALQAGKAYANHQESSHEDVDKVDQQDLSLESKSSSLSLDAEEKSDDRQSAEYQPLALSPDNESAESLEPELGLLFTADEESKPLPQISTPAIPPPEIKTQKSRWQNFMSSLAERKEISDDRFNERQFRVTSRF